MNNIYYVKYLKYKQKYLNLRGGAPDQEIHTIPSNIYCLVVDASYCEDDVWIDTAELYSSEESAIEAGKIRVAAAEKEVCEGAGGLGFRAEYRVYLVAHLPSITTGEVSIFRLIDDTGYDPRARVVIFKEESHIKELKKKCNSFFIGKWDMSNLLKTLKPTKY
jgi:hypothetical protein